MMEEDGASTHHATEATQKYLSKVPQNFFIAEHETTLPSIPVSLQFLASDSFLCIGCENGITNVMSASKWNVQYKLVNEDKSPVMGLAASGEEIGSIKNAVMVVHNEGTMEFWHATSEQLLFSKKYNHSLQSCEISPNGQWYVISGQNGVMLLGHLNKGEPKTLDTGHLGSHGNRVFCIKWNPENPNVFYSGGWDKTVYFWDVRTKTSFNKLYGVFMGGQAIDYNNQKLLLGNNQNSNQLRIFDIKANKVNSIRWDHYTEESISSSVGINSCFFGATSEDIVALSAKDQIRLIRSESCLSLYSHPYGSCGFAMAKHKKQKEIVTAWSNGDIKAFKY